MIILVSFTLEQHRNPETTQSCPVLCQDQKTFDVFRGKANCRVGDQSIGSGEEASRDSVTSDETAEDTRPKRLLGPGSTVHS